MRERQTASEQHAQRGFVLITVLLLVLAITAVGLMAMRHGRFEVRSAGAYVDATQVAELAQGAMAMAMADIKASPEYYRSRFTDPSHVVAGGTDLWQLRYAFPLDPAHFDEEGSVANSYCDAGFDPLWDPGCIRLLTSTDTSDLGGKGGDLDVGTAFYTAVTYDAPLVGPCPPGYACFDDQNYGWYVFGINALALAGTDFFGDSSSLSLWHTRFEHVSRAQGYGRVTIGPIGAFGR